MLPYRRSLQSTPSQNVSTQMGSRSDSSFSVDVFVQTPVRSNVLHDVATQLALTEFFIGCMYSNDPLDRQNFVRQSPTSVQGPRALLQPPPGLEQPAPPPDLATYSHLLTTHGASTISLHYTRRFSYSCTSASPATFSYFSYALHSPLLGPPTWDHIIHVLSYYRQEKC